MVEADNGSVNGEILPHFALDLVKVKDQAVILEVNGPADLVLEVKRDDDLLVAGPTEFLIRQGIKAQGQRKVLCTEKRKDINKLYSIYIW